MEGGQYRAEEWAVGWSPEMGPQLQSVWTLLNSIGFLCWVNEAAGQQDTLDGSVSFYLGGHLYSIACPFLAVSCIPQLMAPI